VSVLHRSRSPFAEPATTANAPQPAGQSQPQPQPPAPVQPGLTQRGRVRRTRVGSIWIGLIAAAVVLILLLVFVLQNSRTVSIHFLGLNGHLSLAVALLLAAVAGLLLVAIPGTARIMQLRRSLKRTHSSDAPS
jgi:uncharacterized integral membrane protein